ncbi:hypothetical protein [Pseudonocardia sp. H11422]|uniref:hypothetical protein n=1 Tax=Pseudonocardia sp. H11422 TaxID=2835866 RepID=UPI001BDD3735|nr:hypothetical protein [Pseudonocardia sp. H11422]
MTSENLWQSAVELADQWELSPSVREFVRELPQNNYLSGLSTLGYQLQSLQASGAEIGAKPLRCAHLIPAFGELAGDVDWNVAGFTEFLDAASAVERANQFLFEWIRSCMSGYPLLPALQLVQGTRLTTQEFTWHLRWIREIRLNQINQQSIPPQILSNLWPGIRPSREASREFVHCCEHLRSRIAETDEIKKHDHAFASLTSGDREALTRMRTRLRDELSDDRVTAEAGTLAMQRNAYRKQVEGRCVEQLPERAKDYCLSFGSAHTLIELVADVFGQLVAYVRPGRVEAVQNPQNLEFEVGDRGQIVKWSASGESGLINCGELRKLDDPLVRETLMITAAEYSFDEIDGNSLKYAGLVLPDSANL